MKKNSKSNLNSNHMKTLLTFFSILFTFFPIAAHTAEKPLLIDIKKSIPTIRPNSLEPVPFYCTYESSDDAVYIDFMENIGHVSITVSNLSTGETVYDTADSAEGPAVLYTSGESGTYILQIGTESGDIYEGEFSI